MALDKGKLGQKSSKLIDVTFDVNEITMKHENEFKKLRVSKIVKVIVL